MSGGTAHERHRGAADDSHPHGRRAKPALAREALELAGTAVRQLDRELRDNGELDAGPSLRQVSLPSVQDWMDEVL